MQTPLDQIIDKASILVPVIFVVEDIVIEKQIHNFLDFFMCFAG